MFRSLIGAIALASSFGALAQALPDPTFGCSQELAFEPRLDAIAEKVALIAGAEATPAMRALDRFATAEERAALELWAHFRQQCFNYGESHRAATYTSAQRALLAVMFRTDQRLLADLQRGRLTYAEFNSSSSQLHVALRDDGLAL
jgi:hypothetical protein